MAAKSPLFAYNWLRLMFNAVSMDRIAEQNSADGVTVLYLSLHTANPINSDKQTSSETNYVGYVRQPVNRTAAALPVSAGPPAQMVLGADVDFPAVGAGSGNQTMTYFGIGLDQAGDGELLVSGPIVPTIPIQAGQTGPVLIAGSYVREV